MELDILQRPCSRHFRRASSSISGVMSIPIAFPVGPTFWAARNTSSPPPHPRSTTTSPGLRLAKAVGLPQDTPRLALSRHRRQLLGRVAECFGDRPDPGRCRLTSRFGPPRRNSPTALRIVSDRKTPRFLPTPMVVERLVPPIGPASGNPLTTFWLTAFLYRPQHRLPVAPGPPAGGRCQRRSKLGPNVSSTSIPISTRSSPMTPPRHSPRCSSSHLPGPLSRVGRPQLSGDVCRRLAL